MTTSSKCSKLKGEYCRLHNPQTQVQSAIMNQNPEVFFAAKDKEKSTMLNPEQVHKIALNVVPRKIDEQHSSYYKATDEKHFGSPDKPGSKFLDPKLRKVEDIIKLRLQQTGYSQHGLEGDDRAELIRKGADPAGFGEGKRYLMVNTPGTVGIINSTSLKDTDTVQIMRTKPGAPCSFVTKVETQPKTDYAVIVLGKHKTTGNDFVITTFPGPITKPTANPDVDAREGQTLTVAEAKKIVGTNFWVNTKL